MHAGIQYKFGAGCVSTQDNWKLFPYLRESRSYPNKSTQTCVTWQVGSEPSRMEQSGTAPHCPGTVLGFIISTRSKLHPQECPTPTFSLHRSASSYLHLAISISSQTPMLAKMGLPKFTFPGHALPYFTALLARMSTRNCFMKLSWWWAGSWNLHWPNSTFGLCPYVSQAHHKFRIMTTVA